MPSALSVFRLLESDADRFQRNLTSQLQQTWAELGVTDGLPPASSTLHFRERRGTQLHFRATHFTETIDRPVRVFLNESNTVYHDVERPTVVPRKGLQASRTTAREIKYGYQEIHKFDVTLDFGEGEILVFYTKDVVDQLMRRFKKAINYETIHFDLARVTELPAIQNVFGAWENSKSGRVTKHAYFGTKLNEEPKIDRQNITSYHVEYDDGSGQVVDLFISRDCKLSTRHPLITSENLLAIYRSMKATLNQVPALSTHE